MAKKQYPGQQSLDDYQLKEVNVRLCLREGPALYSPVSLSNPEAAVDVMRDVLKELDREMVCVVNLDNHMKPVNYNVVSIGALDQSIVPIQNVYKSTILANAAGIMLFHNHPSGDISPSGPDYSVTKRLAEAGKLMDIPLIDHVIIGGMNGNTYSFREHDPDLFSGNPDLSFIRTMSAETAAEKASETRTQYGGNKRMEKMNFDEFKAWAAEEIRGWLPESFADAEIRIGQVEKLGKTYTGMTVRAEDQIAVPTVNLNDFYQEYVSGRDTDAILYQMSDLIEKNTPMVDMGWLTDYDQVKDSLFVRVSNAEANADLLDGVPHTRVEDLAITYHIQMDMPGAGLASTMVTDAMLRQYGITQEQLHEDALRSSEQLLPPRLDSMQNILTGLMAPNFDPSEALYEEPAPGNTMMVLTNSESVNGASALFYPNVMEEAADHFGGNYFVLPSSTHEVIMIPADGTADFRELEQMVREINHTQVAPDERLSDHVYHYDAHERLFERADRHEIRMQQKEKLKEAQKDQGRTSILKKLEEKKLEAGTLNAGKPVPHRKAEQSL